VQDKPSSRKPSESYDFGLTMDSPNDRFARGVLLGILACAFAGIAVHELVAPSEGDGQEALGPGTLTVRVDGEVDGELDWTLNLWATPKEPAAGGERAKREVRGATESFEGLQPGPYHVTLEAVQWPRLTPWITELDQADVIIRTGRNHLRLRLPQLHSLRVHWAGGQEGEELCLNRSDALERFDSRTARVELDATSHAHFERLVAGEYLLFDKGPVLRQMRVTLPCGEIEYAPKRVDALRVVVQDAGGILSQDGFRNGDLVVGVNGEEFGEDIESALERAARGAEDAELSFLVDRAGGRIEITVEIADLGKSKDWGGAWIPDHR